MANINWQNIGAGRTLLLSAQRPRSSRSSFILDEKVVRPCFGLSQAHSAPKSRTRSPKSVRSRTGKHRRSRCILQPNKNSVVGTWPIIFTLANFRSESRLSQIGRVNICPTAIGARISSSVGRQGLRLGFLPSETGSN